MKLKHYGSINPILSRILYWLAGLCMVLDGIVIILTGGYWFPEISQKSIKIRAYFMRKRAIKIKKEQEKVACEIYTKKKRRGYLK